MADSFFQMQLGRTHTEAEVASINASIAMGLAFYVPGSSFRLGGTSPSRGTPYVLRGEGIAAQFIPLSTVTALAATTPPVNTARPIVLGTFVEGTTLSASNGTWDNTPVSYTYQWFRKDGTAISGATSATYAITIADRFDSPYIVVTATNANGSGKASSYAYATVAPSAALPGAAPTFPANAVVLEIDNYFGRAAAMTGVVNSKIGSGSLWVQVTADTTAFRIVKTDVSSRCIIQFDSSKRLRISVSDGTSLFSFRTLSQFLPTDSLDHIAFWYDTNFGAGAKQAMILRNGVPDFEVFSDTAATFTPTQTLGQYFGATNAGASGCAMVLREYMSWPGVKIDWQNAANLAKVYAAGNAVDPGANGQLVTGTAPVVYLSLRGSAAASTFLTNRGTGGDFTQTAGVTLRADMPIIPYGDSLTFGTGSSVYPTKTWVYLVARGLNLPRRRFNYGVGGESLIAITGQSTIKSRFLAGVAGHVAQFPNALYTLEGGYNNLGNVTADIIAAGQDCVNALLAQDPSAKWIFIGIPNGHLLSEGTGTARYNTLTAVNAAWSTAFGARFLDILPWLLTNGLAAAGLTADANDLADIANNTVPRQLRMPDGSVHWNDFGQIAVGVAVRQKLQALGFD